MTVVEERRFERVYADHFEAVLRYCLRRTSREDALDAAVETFTVAWRRKEAVPWETPLPWLYGVAHKVLANQRRSWGRQRRVVTRLHATTAHPGPEVQVVRPAEDERVLNALAALRPEEREVIRLAAWEDLSREEVAVALDCSANAVTKRLNRALDHLAAVLGAEGRSGQRLFRRERNSA